jgi:hypothetical protein
MAARAIELEIVDRTALERVAEGWRRWAVNPDGWFSVPNGEILCRVA